VTKQKPTRCIICEEPPTPGRRLIQRESGGPAVCGNCIVLLFAVFEEEERAAIGSCQGIEARRRIPVGTPAGYCQGGSHEVQADRP
jgi:hypothetical protein